MLQCASSLAAAENPVREDLSSKPGGTSAVALEQPRAGNPAAAIPAASHLLQL